MRHGANDCVNRDFRRALAELAGHRPDKAVVLLRKAVEDCPPTDVQALAEGLYWLAIAELRLDRPELALKSLERARRLKPRGLASKAYARRVNVYGMPRRTSPDLDDFYAFYSIHVCSFLGSKSDRRFSSEEEKDTITRLVHFAWQGLKGSGKLAGLRAEEKLKLFREWPGVFPSFVGRVEKSRASSCDNACREPKVLEFRRGRPGSSH